MPACKTRRRASFFCTLLPHLFSTSSTAKDLCIVSKTAVFHRLCVLGLCSDNAVGCLLYSFKELTVRKGQVLGQAKRLTETDLSRNYKYSIQKPGLRGGKSIILIPRLREGQPAGAIMALHFYNGVANHATQSSKLGTAARCPTLDSLNRYPSCGPSTTRVACKT